MTTTGFRVMLTLNIHPGMEREFEQAWLAADGDLTGQRANLGRWLLRSSTEDSVYFIISDWTDEPSFREFENSEVHLTHRKKLHPYRSGGGFETMRVVYHRTDAG
ncbi:MAG TPA: antibiotic biosynthesis monooxygenase [Rugosimonospora sp.]|nr:antibiotic biosynthesis monooxygenase [Rugosimonospora sp.]